MVLFIQQSFNIYIARFYSTSVNRLGDLLVILIANENYSKEKNY